MAKYESSSLRNVVFIGHGGTGKTSLCETLLFVSGKTEKLGRVDDGSSSLDFEPEEQKRKISISSTITFCPWEKHKINLLDTPGDANFAFDTRNSIRVADAAVVLVDAVGGVEFQTQKVWSFCDDISLPRMIYVSRMDRERADFKKAIQSISDKLGQKTTVIAMPMGNEASFMGVADLISMKMLTFDESKKKTMKEEIPSEFINDAKKLRETLIEDIAECDETLMEKYLDAGELSNDDITAGLRRGILSGDIIPVTCGAAAKNIGTALLLNLIVDYLPSPHDRGASRGKNPKTGEPEERLPLEDAPFSAMVFKTIADPYAGKLTLFRVYSGTLKSDFTFYNSVKDSSERCGNIFFLEGKTQRPSEQLVPGDIAAMAKLKEVSTGDTICDGKNPIIYERVTPLHALISYAVQPKAKGDEEKIASSLQRLIEEDPTITLKRDEQTREFILSGVGQVHVDVTVEKLRRKFSVEVELKLPKVPYKETIKGRTTIQGRYKKQSGGRGQFGDTWLEIEPLPRGGGFVYEDRIVGGVVPRQYIPAVEKGIVEAMVEGVIAGYPMVDIKVGLYDGSYHTVDSSEMAFKIAGSLGFKKGVLLCQPTLLEPIANIAIEIPDEYMGDVIGDLNSRRGRVLGMDKVGPNQLIKGQVPLSEILSYAQDLTSITSGRGTFSYEISHYDEVPAHLQEKIALAAQKAKEE
ncbi:MAG: elongation factor G [Deltaproteobacteria bacterium]|nr:elongation factor G [Deltaproteobacteria bacterium]